MKRFAQLLMIAGMVSMFACSSNTATTEVAVDSTVMVDTNTVVDTTAVDTTVVAQ
ncbi:hypothetical protein [Williamwhitmania taraxaci]|uniref:Entericidin n=1 Tax=Williamwhitmania taraxaci TaxID=1640674 RepID=A0A1G6RD61_9BACT|nr:hypothetical protein [Williamwhitmania taraxaci]SDD01977.1 hypothetical protein SAMN05216323_107211 [Williamwhitmania taraxaci]